MAIPFFSHCSLLFGPSMDEPRTSHRPHPPHASSDLDGSSKSVHSSMATRSHPYLIPEQLGSSILEHNIDCFTGCLQLEHSSSAAPQSVIKYNLDTTMDFTCMGGVNLLKMVNPSDKEIEFLEDRENHNQLNDTTPKKRSNDGSVPCEGMKFTSLEEFEKYYYAYAFSKGFTVRVKKTLKFDRTNIVRYCQYVCSCAGFCDAKQKSNDEVDEDEERKRRKTLTRRSGCPVTITVSKNKGVSKDKGVWKVKTVNNKHNHLLVSPNSQTHLRQHGGIPSVAKKLIEKFSESDLPIGKVPAILNCDAEINVSQRSCWNHRRNLRLMNLDRGDADAVFQYCKRKQVQDANFYYAIQTVAATEENPKDARHPLLGDPYISKTKGLKKDSVKESKNECLKGDFEVAIEQSKK